MDYATDHTGSESVAVGASVAIPVAMFLLSIWALHFRFLAESGFEQGLIPASTVATLLTPFTGFAVLLSGVLLATLVAIEVAIHWTAAESPAN